MVLALALRAKPAALVLAADHLVSGRARFASPGRLPLLLWVLNQTARCVPPCCPSVPEAVDKGAAADVVLVAAAACSNPASHVLTGCSALCCRAGCC